MHQDVSISRAAITSGARLAHTLAYERFGWLQLIESAIEVDGHQVSEGDGLSVDGPGRLVISGLAPQSDVLLFDLA